MPDKHASYPANTDDIDRAYIDSYGAIPEGSFVQAMISVVSYVGPDGSNAWALHYRVDIPATQVIGLLDVSKLEIMARTPNLITNLSPWPEAD